MIQTTPAEARNASAPVVADTGKADDNTALVLRDFKWAYEQYLSGLYEDKHGEHVAIFNQRLVGHNRNVTELIEQVRRELGIDRDQLAIIYID